MSFNSVQIRIVATYLESLTTSTTKDANPCDSELVLLSFVTRRKSKLRYRLVSSSNVVSALFGRSSSEVENPVRPSSSKSDARVWLSPQTISLSLPTSTSPSAYCQTHSQTRLNELCVSSCSLKISVVRLDVSSFFQFVAWHRRRVVDVNGQLDVRDTKTIRFSNLRASILFSEVKSFSMTNTLTDIRASVIRHTQIVVLSDACPWRLKISVIVSWRKRTSRRQTQWDFTRILGSEVYLRLRRWLIEDVE